MSGTENLEQVKRRDWRAEDWAAGATDWVVAAAVLVMANELAHWRLRPGEVVAVLGAWLMVRVGAEFLAWRGLGRVWPVELAAGLGVWIAANFFLVAKPLPAGHFIYTCGLITGAVAGWRCWRKKSAAAVREPVSEPLRILGLALAALGVMWPMLTDRMVGGTDARWYAYTLRDFIGQWRAAGPPVFIGQGDFAWNGGVHPFRTAPVYMHVAGLWDWMTGGALEIGALQHLTAITATLAGALGLYAAGVKLVPARRWETAAVALLYATSPALLLPLYGADAYMTHLAGAAFVLLLYGNARLLVERQGWIPLATGVSLTWMCHPPTAMQATLITGFLQAGGLVFGRGTRRDWGRAAAAAALAGGLSLYYLTGMSELPVRPDGGMQGALLQIAGLWLGWVAAGQWLLMRRGATWALLLLPAGWLLWSTCVPWLVWLGVTVALLAAVGVTMRRWNPFEPADYAPLVMLGCILLAALTMDAGMRARLIGAVGYVQAGQAWRTNWAGNYFQPLAPGLFRPGDLQPGWGLWLAGAAAGLVAFRRRAIAVQLVFGALVLMSMLLLHWPGVSDFLVEFLPGQLRDMAGMVMVLRTMPVFTALLATGAVLVLRELQAQAGGGWKIAGFLLLLAVIWGGWQARLPVERGYRAVASRELTWRYWRTENAPLDHFAYDLLKTPSYYNNGKSDPRLEVRLLDDQGGLLYGPAEMARAMEAAGARTLPQVGRRTSTDERWLRFEPGVDLAPGEQVLLRFEFAPGSRPDGMLLFISEHGYREYRLPQAGAMRAFGSGPEQSKVISLWNSGDTVEHYWLELCRDPASNIEAGGTFGDLMVSNFQPGLAAVQVESLYPWRARTRFARGGWLETMRVFLPGYVVVRDGQRLDPAEFGASGEGLLQVRVPAGEHTVELHYVGTARLRVAGGISLALWIGALSWLCRRKTPAEGGQKVQLKRDFGAFVSNPG